MSAATVTDVRALVKNISTERIGAAWNASSSFTMDLNITDDKTHKAAVYFVDWDRLNRGIIIDVLNGETGALLDSRSISLYNEGRYFLWDVKGHVKFRARTYGGTAVTVSGLFLAPASAAL